MKDQKIVKFMSDAKLYCTDPTTTAIYFEMVFNMLRDRKLKKASELLENVSA